MRGSKFLEELAEIVKESNDPYVKWEIFMKYAINFEKRITRLEILIGSGVLLSLINLIITLIKTFT